MIEIKLPELGDGIESGDVLEVLVREARFSKLAYHNVLDKGGHFAAFEQPELFVTEVRAASKAIREFQG